MERWLSHHHQHQVDSSLSMAGSPASLFPSQWTSRMNAVSAFWLSAPELTTGWEFWGVAISRIVVWRLEAFLTSDSLSLGYTLVVRRDGWQPGLQSATLRPALSVGLQAPPGASTTSYWLQPQPQPSVKFCLTWK